MAVSGQNRHNKLDNESDEWGIYVPNLRRFSLGQADWANATV